MRTVTPALFTLLSLALVGCNDDASGNSEGADGVAQTGAAEAGDGLDDGVVETSADGSGSSGGAEGAEASDGGERLDVSSSDIPLGPGDCMDGGGAGPTELDFSYIWIANSSEGTVSKIDTETAVELARYRTGPAGKDISPSRTSVNLYGDVVIANRGDAGSLTKIAARITDCRDTNGNGTIDTSSGPDDILDWEADECVLWHTEVESWDFQLGPRPLAWEGKFGEANLCEQWGVNLWTGWWDQGRNLGIMAHVDGRNGAILRTVEVPFSAQLHSAIPQARVRGPYGGAVDKDGNFIVVGHHSGPVVRVKPDGTFDSWDWEPRTTSMAMACQGCRTQGLGSYGMALDLDGHVWVASDGVAVKFNMSTGQYTEVDLSNPQGWMRGVAVDQMNRVIFAVEAGPNFPFPGSTGIAVVDATTETVIQPFQAIPGTFTPVGVSVDYEGFAWVVDQNAQSAFKIDLDNGYNVEATVTGLVQPYTYSDMTGAGLRNVAIPPVG